MGGKAAFWRRHLAAWHESGLSQAAYCCQQDISLSSFGYWRGMWGAVPSPPALLPIRFRQRRRRWIVLTRTLPNGLQVRLSIGGDVMPWVPMIRALMAC
jgi:hypothetical protein